MPAKNKRSTIPEIDSVALTQARRAELIARVSSGRVKVNDVPGGETAKRAFEIAAVGGLSVFLLASDGGRFDTSFREDTILVIRALRMSFAAEVSGWADGTALANDLFVSFSVPECDIMLPCPCETGDVIRARVEAARLRSLSGELDGAAATLLIEAQRHGYTSDDAAKTVRIAACIAKLDEAERIKRVHVAEALSYLGDRARVEAADPKFFDATGLV